ncbi:translation elongation factor Ts [Candidatus Peregrinibacteria bacterium]|nr:MAG: translation elongation factor Ts [Candidatus Peregrinibacteria bacterium]
MTDISAKSVMELRQKTGVSMMACKSALQEAEGDTEKAIEILRKKGAMTAEKKSGRVTAEGAIAVSGRALASVRCETDFVARSEGFRKFVQELADKASTDGVEKAKEHFEEKKNEMIAVVGENLLLGDVAVIPEGDTVGSYIHSNAKVASVVALTGGTEEVAKDIAMHVVANSPKVIEPADIEDKEVAKEKEIWKEQLIQEGKSEEIIEKILLGKEKKYREEQAIQTQPFVKNPDVLIKDYVASENAVIESFSRAEV